MTCYQRHLGWLFEAVGTPNDKEHRKELHAVIVPMLGLADDAQCPEVWATLKRAYGIDAKTQSVELAADVAKGLAARG